MTTTIADMAREIERRRPGTLQASVRIASDCLCQLNHEEVWIELQPDLAAAVLRDAMLMTIRTTQRAPTRGDNFWLVFLGEDESSYDAREFRDADHGNDPTRSLFAAFCAAFPTKGTAP